MRPLQQLFFGRERELSELEGALREAERGRGALQLLVGEPGIGKTRLAAAFSDKVSARGVRVTWGRAWEAGGAPAYWPWIEALRPLAANLKGAPRDAERSRIAALVRLLPELAAFGAPPAPADPGQERFLLFDAVATFLSCASREEPLVLVLDDLHAADLGTLELLHFVARGLRASRVIVVGTYRDSEARLSADAGDALARIAREGRYLKLDRLGRDDVLKWVATEGHGDADALLTATEGHPLFVVEMLRLARDEGFSHGVPAGRLPDGVRDVIRSRLARLSDDTHRLLAAASVLGRAVDLGLAASLAELPLEEARDRAREATLAELFVDGREGKSFSHILIREVLYHELPAAKRNDLHARAGRMLAERHAADDDASLAHAVHHLFAAVPLVEADEAIAWARRAASRAAQRMLFDEASEMLVRALEHLPPIRDTERCDLLLRLATAQAGAGQATRGRETAVLAAEIARRLGDAERLAQAALRCGEVYLIAVVDRVLIGLLEEALARLPQAESVLRARLLSRLAAALQPDADPARPIAMARTAITMARRTAGEHMDRNVLVAATSALLYFADPKERLPLDRELVELAERAGDRIAAVRGLLRLVFDHLELGDTTNADHAIEDYDRLSIASGLPMLRWRAPMLRAMRAVMDGRFQDSEALCSEAATIAERVDDRAAQVSLKVHTIGRLLAEGRLEEVSAHLPSALDLLGRMADPVYTRAFRIGMLARMGRAGEARADLDALVRHHPPLLGRPMLVWAADACLALGDAQCAEVLAKLLEPMQARHFSWSPIGMVMEGPIADWVSRLRALKSAALSGAALSGAALESEARVAGSMAALPEFQLTLEGEVWTIVADTTFRLPVSRGLTILAELVNHPGQEFHVTTLMAPRGEQGLVDDAGDTLDDRAIAAYKRRLADLREAEAEATLHNDPARAERAHAEIQGIAEELARGVGLGGRARKASSTSEKARVNVRQRLQGAIKRIERHSPRLAKHLRQTIRTGAFCCYNP